MTRGRFFVLMSLAVAVLAMLPLVRGPELLSAPLSTEVEIARLTWVELREAIRAGRTTIIVPTGGTEQNGPHMVLGKHNFIVAETARRVAEKLGDALVAPVIAYVPEGDPDSKDGHMAFPGTISVSEETFEKLLEDTARSFHTHGFKTIVFIGDSGGNQMAQARVAEKLSALWRGDGVKVVHARRYYARNGAVHWLEDQGESAGAIGSHAGIQDTSELLAVWPDGIRPLRAKPGGGTATEPTGVSGDPSRASAAYGEKLLSLKVEAALKDIRDARK